MNAEPARLAGKVAIVSGGSGAIGRSIVDALAQARARAFSLDLLEPDGQRGWFKCDVREETSIAVAIDAVTSTGWRAVSRWQLVGKRWTREALRPRPAMKWKGRHREHSDI